MKGPASTIEVHMNIYSTLQYEKESINIRFPSKRKDYDILRSFALHLALPEK
jgi:hypothetical protein